MLAEQLDVSPQIVWSVLLLIWGTVSLIALFVFNSTPMFQGAGILMVVASVYATLEVGKNYADVRTEHNQQRLKYAELKLQRDILGWAIPTTRAQATAFENISQTVQAIDGKFALEVETGEAEPDSDIAEQLAALKSNASVEQELANSRLEKLLAFESDLEKMISEAEKPLQDWDQKITKAENALGRVVNYSTIVAAIQGAFGYLLVSFVSGMKRRRI